MGEIWKEKINVPHLICKHINKRVTQVLKIKFIQHIYIFITRSKQNFIAVKFILTTWQKPEKTCLHVETLIRTNCNFKVHKVICAIGEGYATSDWKIEFTNICNRNIKAEERLLLFLNIWKNIILIHRQYSLWKQTIKISWDKDVHQKFPFYCNCWYIIWHNSCILNWDLGFPP